MNQSQIENKKDLSSLSPQEGAQKDLLENQHDNHLFRLSRSVEVPSLHDAALYGLVGRVVEAISPETEAHPAALLLHLLTFFGNAVGRNPHWTAEATRHALNLFVVLVGSTSMGRKGTAQGHIKSIFQSVEPEWAARCMRSGLSTGEGLIYHIRDPIGRDEGIDDKRLLAIEPEFARVLKVASREGNTISTTLRQAFDGENLSTLTRNDPLRATNAHISLIGHITRGELIARLEATEAASGFGNRFLWAHVHRVSELPSGGDMPHLARVLSPLQRELRDIVQWAQTCESEIRRTSEGEEFWTELYPYLTREAEGLVGALTSRAAPLVMRVASLYGLLDGSLEIHPHHLGAATAVWQYCQDSVRQIFGETTGHLDADKILKALSHRSTGLSRHGLIRDVFHNHISRESLQIALDLLLGRNLVVRHVQKTKGRPREMFTHYRYGSAIKATEVPVGVQELLLKTVEVIKKQRYAAGEGHGDSQPTFFSSGCEKSEESQQNQRPYTIPDGWGKMKADEPEERI